MQHDEGDDDDVDGDDSFVCCRASKTPLRRQAAW